MVDYESEIERLNEERRVAAERINELMKYRDLKKKLEVCNTEGHLWTLTRVASDFDTVTHISLLCTRSGATVDVDLTGGDEPTLISYKDMDGNLIPQEILDAAVGR
ncbi:hypothetical protein [Phenylobacterium sp.]|uniref:hypothetical protein n=1 Tax=Phenylobacterium sp. TaxID=1871053 RepID=UPI000C8F04C5|nr:hypothetical protein [Phenylobacterium sp.]MAK80353.1 hypothetical protein [Phenylobacterium sp.]|tara:strand:- start:134 stop:451 length:318 start_codon:yes stop_codon:yes gene_type:complete